MPATPIPPSRPPSRGPAPLDRGTAPARSYLRIGLFASTITHAFVLAFVLGLFDSAPQPEVVAIDRSVDVEIAPRPPKAQAPIAEVAPPPERRDGENARPPNSADVLQPQGPPSGIRDAGVDVAPDAALRKKRRPRPIPDAGLVIAVSDGGASDAVAVGDGVALGDAGIGVAIGEIDAAAGSASEAATADSGTGSGQPIVAHAGIDDAGLSEKSPVDGAKAAGIPSEADPALGFVGTAANLFAYFPPGQVVAALVRFDRLRGTEWASAAEELLRPMPDYRALFGRQDAQIHSAIDVLAISSARPRDPKATTLVMKTQLSRRQVRELLANPAAPIAWSSSGGGLLGRRGGGRDSRILLSPWQQWYVLAAPHDLSGVLSPATGEFDAIEAKAAMPAWLSSIRTIEGEAGKEEKGPALVVTLGWPRSSTIASGNPGEFPTRDAAKSRRYALPGLGLGVSSLPLPTRASIALELVKQGWLVRGTMRFASEAEAREFVESVRDVQRRVLDSFVLSAIVARHNGRNALEGLSLLRSGTGVSYATSLSITDARAVLAIVARALADHFGQ